MADMRPEIGDVVDMSFMGGDVRIEIAGIPEEQPLVSEGVWDVVDQYGETHRIELDGDVWTTMNEGMLS